MPSKLEMLYIVAIIAVIVFSWLAWASMVGAVMATIIVAVSSAAGLAVGWFQRFHAKKMCQDAFKVVVKEQGLADIAAFVNRTMKEGK